MILWKSKEEVEKTLEFLYLGRRVWRWVLEVTWTSISFEQQVKFPDLPSENVWRPRGRYYQLNVTRHFLLGRQHGYYDGPHDGFSVGWFHYCWSGDWCQKCYDGA